MEVEERLDPKPRVGEVWDARLPRESGYPHGAGSIARCSAVDMAVTGWGGAAFEGLSSDVGRQSH